MRWGLVFSLSVIGGCSWFTQPPVEDGSVLTYHLVETQRQTVREHTLNVRLTDSEEVKDAFKLDVLGQFGGRTLNVFEKDLMPALETDDPLAFPTALGPPLDPGSLWLPSAQRQKGAIGMAGMTQKITTFKQFEVWQVQAPDGLAYYALESGLLVGFSYDRVDINIKATLVSFKK